MARLTLSGVWGEKYDARLLEFRSIDSVDGVGWGERVGIKCHETSVLCFEQTKPLAEGGEGEIVMPVYMYMMPSIIMCRTHTDQPQH